MSICATREKRSCSLQCSSLAAQTNPRHIVARWKWLRLLAAMSVFLSSVTLGVASDQEWLRRYNGPANGSDLALAMAVDTAGNVYVTGYTDGGESRVDYTTVKYSAAGDTLWVRSYNGPGDVGDIAHDIALDDSGNVYVTGASGPDIATIKYSPAGDTLWVRRYHGAEDCYNSAYAISVGDDGSVYVTGSGFDLPNDDCIGTTDRMILMKYSPSGDVLWLRDYMGPSDSGASAGGHVVTASGEIVLWGSSLGFLTLVKYTAAGDTLWTRHYGEPGLGSLLPVGAAVDSDGNICIANTFYTGSSSEIATLKYDANGGILWERRHNGSARAIAVDDSGNVCVTGKATIQPSSSSYTTVKYSDTGDSLWVRDYLGPGSGGRYPDAIVVDDSGNVYVTGSSQVGSTDYDIATVKYSAAGTEMWVRRYDGPATENSIDRAYTMAVDRRGTVYVAGWSAGVATALDYATIKYQACPLEVMGDITRDAFVTTADILALVNTVFKGAATPALCVAAGDINCDGMVASSDIIALVNYVFKSGPAPCDVCNLIPGSWSCP